MADDNPFRIDGLSHAGITVSDMERSLAFYRDGLGLEVYIDRIADHDYLREVTSVPSANVRIVYVQIPAVGRPWSSSSTGASSACLCARDRATRATSMWVSKSPISTPFTHASKGLVSGPGPATRWISRRGPSPGRERASSPTRMGSWWSCSNRLPASPTHS